MTGIANRSSKGFTLIELLVVIAIIALLLSILMPALNKAKEQARIILDGSNMNQSGKGVYAYATEFDGYLPPMIQLNSKGIPDIGTGLGNYVRLQGFGLLVAEPYGWSPTGYIANAEPLICPVHRDGYVIQGWIMEREKYYFFRRKGTAGPAGNYMSYSYAYATPFDMHPARLLWHEIPRYRLEKTEGKAVILFERGYWGDDPNWDFWFNPPYHKEGLSALHLNGRAHFIKGKRLESSLK